MTNPISQKQNEVHICADKNMDSVVPSGGGIIAIKCSLIHIGQVESNKSQQNTRGQMR